MKAFNLLPKGNEEESSLQTKYLLSPDMTLFYLNLGKRAEFSLPASGTLFLFPL
jgi:hypothetical protein